VWVAIFECFPANEHMVCYNISTYFSRFRQAELNLTMTNIRTSSVCCKKRLLRNIRLHVSQFVSLKTYVPRQHLSNCLVSFASITLSIKVKPFQEIVNKV